MLSRQDIRILLLEAPLLGYIVPARTIWLKYYAVTGSETAATLIYWVVFVVICILTAYMFNVMRVSALRRVSGVEYLVGGVYGRGGDDYLELPLGRYRLLETRRIPRGELYGHGSGEIDAYIYAVFGRDRDTAEYLLVSPQYRLEELLTKTTRWLIDAGWDIVETDRAYLVTLYRCETRGFDPLKRGGDGEAMDIPIYIVRDAPGLVEMGEAPAAMRDGGLETLGVAARDAFDRFRSLQLQLEVESLRRELGAVKRARDTIDDLALDKAMAFIEADSENRKIRRPKLLGFRLGKWGWIAIIVAMVLVFGWWALSRYLAVVGGAG